MLNFGGVEAKLAFSIMLSRGFTMNVIAAFLPLQCLIFFHPVRGLLLDDFKRKVFEGKKRMAITPIKRPWFQLRRLTHLVSWLVNLPPPDVPPPEIRA